jgi:hypothetical protein
MHPIDDSIHIFGDAIPSSTDFIQGFALIPKTSITKTMPKVIS